jgi:hypothetical protein
VLFSGLGSSISFSLGAQLVGTYRCEDERVLPNLHLAKPVQLTGIVVDGSGAKFTGISMQLEKAHASKELITVVVDDKGRFDFGTVSPGEFRLLPVKLQNGKSARVPGFDPPPSSSCFDDKICELRVVLPARPTDMPYTFCPPK